MAAFMLDRRALLTTGAAALALGGLARAFDDPVAAADAATLTPDPASLLDLAPGFAYTRLASAGTIMSDGLITPSRFDGMAAFAGPGGRTVLVRNHELWPENDDGPFGPDARLLTPAIRAKMFDGQADPPCIGGTTTLILSPEGRVERSFLSLAGTMRNCAGGATPWGSWLSCEEPRRSLIGRISDGHGWVFEVPSTARALVDPVPLKALGRFNHEAAAVDPQTGIVYLTEDQRDGLLYRLLPETPGALRRGGRLQAMAVRDIAEAANRDGAWQPGTAQDVRWIDLDAVEAPDDDLRLRGAQKGATRFVRGEGLAFDARTRALYISCTKGGPNERGQIFRYQPSRLEGQSDEAQAPGRIELFLEPRDRAVLDMPDNLCVAPQGGLILCEDGDGDGENYLRAVTRDGRIRTLARNAHPQGDEFAGACFAPDGRTLFVNIYRPGFTLAIRGPFDRLFA